MSGTTRVLILLAVIAAGVYVYKSNWFVELDAELGLAQDHVSILAREQDYHDCKVKLTGEFSTEVEIIPQNSRYFIQIFKFKQWNGTPLESTELLESKVRVSLWCDEGRKSEYLVNHFSKQ